MAISPPLKELNIKMQDSGFYNGFNQIVVVASKIVLAVVVLWCLVFPEQAGNALSAAKNWSFNYLNWYYIFSVAFFIVTCLIIAIVPSFGRIKLGVGDDKPEFSTFSWFSMMFGAGIGIGMLGYAAGEPLFHFANNPDIIKSKEAVTALLSAGGIALEEGADIFAVYNDNVASGAITAIDGVTIPKTESAVESAYRYTFLHWGIGAWASYALIGITIAFFSYNRGLPLTVRSGLTSIFGKKLEGNIGHAIDISAIIATILGISQTIGLGLSSFASGLHNITGMEWLMTDGRGSEPTTGALMLALIVVMLCSTASALSGVGRGIKWLSNINMVLSYSLLAFFLIFGSTMFIFEVFGKGLFSYVIHLPALTFTIWDPSTALGQWQTGWSVFYWAWWIAFAPFVGLFLARISKGRTIREFVLGAMIVPSLMCFVWFTWAGGTAIDLELTGGANGAIMNAPDGDKIFAMTTFMLSPISQFLSWAMSAMIVVLLMTYLVTTADSAVLIVNTINAAGDEGPKARPHIIFWGVALGAVVAALLLVGGLKAIQTAMVIGALPFSVVMVLQCAALVKAIYNDGKREAAGQQTVVDSTPAE
jgi:choline-glycine betaine transporter